MSTSNISEENRDKNINKEGTVNENYKKENITPITTILTPRKDRRSRKSKTTPKKRTRNLNCTVGVNCPLVLSSNSPPRENRQLEATYSIFSEPHENSKSTQCNTKISQRLDDTLTDHEKTNSSHETDESMKGERLRPIVSESKVPGRGATKQVGKHAVINLSKSTKLLRPASSGRAS